MYNYGCPVNWNHPLNRGLVYWFNPLLQNWWFGNTLYNLTGLGDAALTNVTRKHNALYFDGSTSEGVIPLKPTISFANFTVLVDCYLFSSVNLKTVISCSQLTVPYGTWDMRYNTTGGNNRMEGFFSTVDTQYSGFYGNIGTGAQQRHTWCFTYDGQTGNMYEDGLLVTTNAAPSGPAFTQTVGIKIGNNATTNRFWYGDIFNIRLLTRGYSAGEVMEDYQLARKQYPGVLNTCNQDLAVRLRKRPNSNFVVF